MPRSLAAALLVVAGCSPALVPPRLPADPARQLPVWVDYDFAPEDAREVRRAVERWDVVLNGRLHAYVASQDFSAPHDDPVLGVAQAWRNNDGISVDHLTEWARETRRHPDLWLAWAPRNAHQIYVVPHRIRRFGFSVEAVTLHEIGHVLGAHHTTGDEPPTLMSDTSERAMPCVDDVTVVQVADAHHWRPEELVAECESDWARPGRHP